MLDLIRKSKLYSCIVVVYCCEKYSLPLTLWLCLTVYQSVRDCFSAPMSLSILLIITYSHYVIIYKKPTSHLLSVSSNQPLRIPRCILPPCSPTLFLQIASNSLSLSMLFSLKIPLYLCTDCLTSFCLCLSVHHSALSRSLYIRPLFTAHSISLLIMCKATTIDCKE